MSVLNVNIRPFNSRAESPKLYTLYSVPHTCFLFLSEQEKSCTKLPHLPLFHLLTHGHSAAQPSRASCSVRRGWKSHGCPHSLLFSVTQEGPCVRKDLMGPLAGRVSWTSAA